MLPGWAGRGVSLSGHTCRDAIGLLPRAQHRVAETAHVTLDFLCKQEREIVTLQVIHLTRSGGHTAGLRSLVPKSDHTGCCDHTRQTGQAMAGSHILGASLP